METIKSTSGIEFSDMRKFAVQFTNWCAENYDVCSDNIEGFWWEDKKAEPFSTEELCDKFHREIYQP